MPEPDFPSLAAPASPDPLSWKQKLEKPDFFSPHIRDQGPSLHFVLQLALVTEVNPKSIPQGDIFILHVGKSYSQSCEESFQTFIRTNFFFIFLGFL